MADELQGLLDRIQKDGVAQAEAEANRILETAREKAREILAEAESTRVQKLEEVAREAEAAAARGRRSIEQAARDVLLGVRERILAQANALLATDVQKALSGEALAQLIDAALERYAQTPGASIEVLVPDADRDRIAAHLQRRFTEAAGAGIRVTGGTLGGGFRLVLEDGKLYHDFSAEAVAEALARLVRPQLAELLRKAGA